MTHTLQNILIVLGIIAIGAIGFYLYFENGDISVNNAAVNNKAAAETANFLQRLNELQVIELKGKVLIDERFKSLVDFSEVVVPSPFGKSNPFVANN